MDYSFLRLRDNFSDAKNIGDSPSVTHSYYASIQLIPDKSYLQITNFDGGISLTSDCEVFVVDCNDNVLADITDNVFISEFIDNNGNNQCKIELVNLGVDFYRTTVFLKFDMLSSNANFWSVPINITSYQEHLTTFFKYRNYDDFMGIGYTNANVFQAISLSLYYDIPVDETEVEDYFQISRNNTISARALIKTFERYKIQEINRFTFERLNILLKHELIYMDNIRVTNKPVVESNDRFGDSNIFETDFLTAKNYNDVSPYEFQIFGGLQISEFDPFGNYITGFTISSLSFIADMDISLSTGSINVFLSNGMLVDSFDQTSMSIENGNELKCVTVGSDVENLSDGSYYVTVTEGLVFATQLGIQLGNEAIQDSDTWVFDLQAADYDSDDYDSNDYFTGL